MTGAVVAEMVKRIEDAAIIARQNDAFRAALAFGSSATIPGQVFMTPGVAAEGPAFMALLLLAVAGFSDFNEGNDPHGDHSFGVIENFGVRVYWKIDLYDENFEFGAEEPTIPEKTRRVLTLLLPSEY